MSGRVTTKTTAGRIEQKFAELRARDEAALIPFIVAGDPDLETTRALVLELEARGADLIELGVPFSDPMADGPANQRALARGLASGASLAAILAMVSEAAHVKRRFRSCCSATTTRFFTTDASGCAPTLRAPASTACWSSICRPRKRPSLHVRRAPTASTSSICSRRPRRSSAARTIARSAQRLSLLRLGDRSDRRAHQPRRRTREPRARPAHGDRSADRRRLRHLDRRRRRREVARLRRRGGGRQRDFVDDRARGREARTRGSGRRIGGRDEGGDARGARAGDAPQPEAEQWRSGSRRGRYGGGRTVAADENIWVKCPGCKEIAFRKEVERNLNVCPKCGYPSSADRRAAA